MAESDNAELRSQLDQMTERLVAAERRAKTLAELNRLLAQGRDPLEWAQRAVDLVLRATRASGSFVYIWDPDVDRLVLRVATDGGQAAHLGNVRLRLGEGITGWAALMRQPVVVQDDIRTDPRYVSFPFLDDDRFKSMISVPAVVNGSELLGVFNVLSTNTHAFDRHDVELATEVGGLLASGLVQAQMLKDLRRQSLAAQFLLSVSAEASTSLQRCVDELAEAIREQVDAAVCTIEVADRTNASDRIRPGVAYAADINPQAQSAARTARSRGDLAAVRAGLGDGIERYVAPFGPLVTMGTVTCYRPRPFSASDGRLIEALTAQSAVLLASLGRATDATPLVGRLAGQASLTSAERALCDMGWRSGPTHPVVIKLQSAQFRSSADFDRLLHELSATSAQFEDVVLVPSPPTITALVPHKSNQWPRFVQALRSALKNLPSASPLPAVAGIGPLASDADALQRNLRRAELAVVWADLLGEAVIDHDDVAHLRGVPRVAVDINETLAAALTNLRTIAKYDMSNGTELAKTLDTFLSSGSSMNETSESLFIHRNTLRQRLARIEELIGRPVDAVPDQTAFALAARLTALDRRARTE